MTTKIFILCSDVYSVATYLSLYPIHPSIHLLMTFHSRDEGAGQSNYFWITTILTLIFLKHFVCFFVFTAWRQKELWLKGNVLFSIQLFFEETENKLLRCPTCFCSRNRAVKLWALLHPLLIQEKFWCLWLLLKAQFDFFLFFTVWLLKYADERSSSCYRKQRFYTQREAAVLLGCLSAWLDTFCWIKRLISKCNQTKVLTHNPSVQVCVMQRVLKWTAALLINPPDKLFF